MTLYVESSAILRVVLGTEDGASIAAHVQRAERVVASRLTLAEVERVLQRAASADPERAGDFAALAARFRVQSDGWFVVPVDEAQWARCGRPFPAEPVRTLDGLHLAAIEAVGRHDPDLVVLSTDDRLCRNAGAAGFRCLP